MVKKKAIRAKVNEKKALSSSARANDLEVNNHSLDMFDQQEWAEGMDIHVPKEAETISAAEKDFQTRKQNARLTKKQKKRIEILKERKKKKEQRADLYKSLAKHQMSKEETDILQASSRIGQIDSAKHKLKVALKKNRLGIETPDVEVFQTVTLSDEKEFPAPMAPVEAVKVSMPDPVECVKKRKRKQKGNIEKVKSGKGFFVSIPEDEEPALKRQKTADAVFSDEEEEEVTNLHGEQNETPKEDKESFIKAKKVAQTPIKATKTVVQLQRPEELEETRTQLPIYMEEQAIMEQVSENPVVIICGETGSGKTTQVPQFLYEAGYGQVGTNHSGMIAVTQPRRVAAVSVAKRVAAEMGVELGKEVGYQVRYQKKVSSTTILKFMTDGVLLRELHSDFLLSRYSAIMLDEAHERGINTDILIGLLSRIVPLRAKLAAAKAERNGKIVEPLSLIIMSATLRVEDFVGNTVLFNPPPPVVHIKARMFPVTIHFNRITPLQGYEDEVFRKTSKIHNGLPPGGILIFMTGQQEIEGMCRQLRMAFPLRKSKHDGDNEEGEDVYSGMHVLPLYSLLRTDQQLKVFDEPPPGSRLVVVSTNVAETSVTIPGIKYVVDTGKVKMKTYEGISGMSKFEVNWTSQASCDQRAGRAGRVSAGHCYRLFSSAVFNDYFPKFTAPEITETPIDGVVLQMKCMGIDKIQEFPFPTPPELTAIVQAVMTLQNLEALESTPVDQPRGEKFYPQVTNIGRTLSLFPVSPRFAKMLSLGKQGGCMPYIIAIVASLSVQSYPLLRGSEEEDEVTEENVDEVLEQRERIKKQRRSANHAHKKWFHPLSDLLTILRAIGAYEHAVFVLGQDSTEFCHENLLHERSMKEIHLLRLQLTEIIDSISGDAKAEVEMEADERENTIKRISSQSLKKSFLVPPSAERELMLRQIIMSGLSDRVATLARNQPIVLDEENQKPSKNQYICCTTNNPIYIHPTSVLFRQKPLPDYVVFTELHATPKKTYMKGLTVISPSWLPNLSKNLCEITKVLGDPAPGYDQRKDMVVCHARPSYSGGWILPPQQTSYPECLDAYKWFARHLLAGQVLSYFDQFKEKMTAQPSLLTSAWNIKKVNGLVEPLALKKIRTLRDLQKQWEKEPRYLLDAIQPWILQSAHRLLSETWPPRT